MKKPAILLVLILSTSFCFGQILFSENGLSLRYDGNEKIGSRYDEYCKTSFDIYRVKGTVININGDKAATVTAILNFDGHTCNKIYSNDRPTGGEIMNKVYILDIPGQTKHKSEYWVNRWVKLLPNDEMTAYGNVEVKQGEPCPEPNHYFTYELIPSQSNVSNNKSEETITGDRPVNNIANYSSLIVGKWQKKHYEYYKDGSVMYFKNFTPQDYWEFKIDGNGLNSATGREKPLKMSWKISGNVLSITTNMGYEVVSEKFEIVRLDKTTFVFKLIFKDGGYSIFTYENPLLNSPISKIEPQSSKSEPVTNKPGNSEAQNWSNWKRIASIVGGCEYNMEIRYNRDLLKNGIRQIQIKNNYNKTIRFNIHLYDAVKKNNHCQKNDVIVSPGQIIEYLCEDVEDQMYRRVVTATNVLFSDTGQSACVN